MDWFKQNKFLEDVVKRNKEQNDKYEEKAFKSIIENLFIKNKWGKEKAMGLDEYDSEKNRNLIFVPGHIYTFKYMSNTPVKYEKGLIKIEFLDTLPIMLCLSVSEKTVFGINLNLCNLALRTLILNDIYNMDPEFFNRDATVQAHQGKFPMSKRVTSFFMVKENVEKFCNYLIKKYKLKETALIFRIYSINKIQAIRFIEIWQWQYIPFINYKQSIKQSILQSIQLITGINNIHI